MSYHKDTNKIIANKYFKKDYLFEEDPVSEKSALTFLFEDFSKDEIIQFLSDLFAKVDQKHSHTK